MFVTIVKCTILLNYIYFNGVKGDDPIAETTYGKILGIVETTEEGNVYYAFHEVPFASPPIGNLRFKEPQPPQTWLDVLQTTQNTKICHQVLNLYTTEDLTETEDCLYLNVYTPKNPVEQSADLLPVIFWIHGGGFTIGDGTPISYGPKYFMDYDVVLVSTNYRLGPLGFLSTEDGVIPGNLGLKDQNFALKWVQDNIQNFGGDPSKVTIMGESAGAMSVGYHLLSERSKGLFRAAILQSGTAITSSAVQIWPEYFAFETARAFDSEFASNDSTELLEYLQSIPAEDLIKVQLDIPSEKENGIGSHSKGIWKPVIEDENLDDAFITGLMHEDIKNGNVTKVPILIGFNSEEELLFIDYDLQVESKMFDDNLELLIHNKYSISEEDKSIVATKLREIYTQTTFEDNPGSIVKFLSDAVFTTPAARQAYLECGYTDVYLYEFSHKGVLGGNTTFVEGAEYVAHGDELHYFWDLQSNPDNQKIPISDTLTRNRLLKLWTNFAKHLNPTPEEDPLLNFITWPKVQMDIKHEILYLNINTTLEVKANPKHYREFEKIIDKYVTEPLAYY